MTEQGVFHLTLVAFFTLLVVAWSGKWSSRIVAWSVCGIAVGSAVLTVAVSGFRPNWALLVGVGAIGVGVLGLYTFRWPDRGR